MINGIHHVTAIAGDAQTNVNFYVGVLGLRLVKKTINYDDPQTYHLYYGDAQGSPGTLLTFFPWSSQARRGQTGLGQVMQTSLSIPPGTANAWYARLNAHKVEWVEPESLVFRDPDGLELALVEDESIADTNGDGIRGIYGVALASLRYDESRTFLADRMQFPTEPDGDLFVTGKSWVFVDAPENLPRAVLGAGTMHHVAFRVPNDATELAWQTKLHDAGVGVTDVRDRQYFRSIYFHEPGGVLFEIATDPPGFMTDETLETLGTRLCLPEWLEAQRAEIESGLPPLTVPMP